MGVDYVGVYGIGLELKILIPKKWLKKNGYIDGEDYDYHSNGLFPDYLEDILEGQDRYTYGEIGSGMYTGSTNTFYILIEEPFELGYDMTQKAEDLIQFCKDKGLKTVGNKVDVVGGLLVH